MTMSCRSCGEVPPLGGSVVYFTTPPIKMCHGCYDPVMTQYVQLGLRENWLKRIVGRDTGR